MNNEQEKQLLFKIFILWIKCYVLGWHRKGSKTYFGSWEYCKDCDQGYYL